VKFAGVEVARIGMGTNRLTDKRENVAFVKAAVAAGVQVIDTAHLYTGGQSEETIGTALSPMPDNVIVATKGGFNGASAAVIRSEIDESLRRLHALRIEAFPAAPFVKSNGDRSLVLSAAPARIALDIGRDGDLARGDQHVRVPAAAFDSAWRSLAAAATPDDRQSRWPRTPSRASTSTTTTRASPSAASTAPGPSPPRRSLTPPTPAPSTTG